MSDIRSPHEAERLLTVAPEAYHTRRDFLKRTAASAGLAASMGLVLDPDVVVAEAARRQRRVKLPSPRNLPIDTFVVLMMENRSFDHYLGWLPGADGRQAGLEFTDPAGQKHLHAPAHLHSRAAASWTPTTRGTAGAPSSTAGAWTASCAPSPTRSRSATTSEADVPFTPHAAKAFTAFDRFFCSLLGPTYPNREYMHAAQSYGMIGQLAAGRAPRASGSRTRPSSTPLTQAGVSNRYFYTDLPLSALWGAAGLARSVTGAGVLRARRRGHPAGAVVRGPGVPGRETRAPRGDEHPLADIRVGQAFVADVVHAFIELAAVQARRAVHDLRRVGRLLRSRRPAARARPAPEPRSRQGLRADGLPHPRRRRVALRPPRPRRPLDLRLRVDPQDDPLPLRAAAHSRPRDLYANNIAAAFDFESKPDYAIPDLPTPPEVIVSACAGTLAGRHRAAPASTTARSARRPPPFPRSRRPSAHRAEMLSSGYLERLGFRYKPATPATMYRHPSKLGMRA